VRYDSVIEQISRGDMSADHTPKAIVKTSLAERFASLKPFLGRPALAMILMGFATGLPLSLIFDTLSVWLRDVGLSLEVIGFFSLATFAYSLKFVWAPLVDRVSLPFLTAWLGHRRGWILLMEGLIMLGLFLISGFNPKDSLGTMALIAVSIGFAGATHDIVLDAWRIETAGDLQERQALMATASAWGARIAPFVAGIAPLALADSMGWGFAYALMAALMGLGILGVFIAPREAEHKVRAIDYGDIAAHPATEAIEWALRLFLMLLAACLMGAGLTANITLFKPVFALLDPSLKAFDAANVVWTSKTGGIFWQFPAVVIGLATLFLVCMPLPGHATRPGAYLRQTFVVPIAAFFKRHDNLASLILVTICVYRIADFLLNINGAFYLDLGFDKLAIAEVRKIFGVLMTMLGVALGGVFMTTLGIRNALVLGAIVGSLSNLAYGWLAFQGNNLAAFSIALAIDNISGGIAGTVLIAYMSSLISKGFAAQQYALFTSVYALPGKLLASQSGRIVESTAKSVEHDGTWGWFRGFFSHMPEISYAKPAAALGVAREALGTAYLVFFSYTTVIGFLAVILAIWLIAIQKEVASEPESDL
jgi:MFS transporter, PAT family, beta-lactamase induction signal transducer AmpG